MSTIYFLSIAIFTVLVGANSAQKHCSGEIVYTECPNHTWQKFTRKDGTRVCLKVMHTNINYYESVALCRANDAVLFGIDSADEMEYIKKYYAGDLIYIGAFRRPACNKSKQENDRDPNCTKQKMFEFTDGYTKSDYLWHDKWYGTNPESIQERGEFESAVCVLNGLVGDVLVKTRLAGALCGIVLKN